MTKISSFVPAGAELSEAIAKEIKESVGPTNAKSLQQNLVKEHPNWKVPERRVNKFLKRQMNQHKNPSGADDDQTAVMDDPPRDRGRKIRNFFSRRSAAETQPPAEILEAAPETAPAPVPSPMPGKEEAKVPEPEPVVKRRSKSFEDVYVDDNDTSKWEKCECNACAIM